MEETAEVLEQESGEAALALPRSRCPTGWFMVGWSDDLPCGGVRPLRYFGQDLVCWRGEGGAPHVLDALCLHLGGHLGVGGRVEGDEIVCPWHEWHWNGEGANTLIPYSAEGCKRRLRIRSWPCRDWYGILVVWHDLLGRPPMWELPAVPELDSGRYYPLHPHSRMVHRLRMHPQIPMENAVDPAHIVSVHKASRIPRILTLEFGDFHMHETVEANFGGGHETTWVTPGGPVDAVLVFDTYGLGIGSVRFREELVETVLIAGFTPFDDQFTEYFFVQASVREPGDTGEVPQGRAARFLRFQQGMVRQDFFTWEHMRRITPSFALEEAGNYARFRRWARRFYPWPDGSHDAAGPGVDMPGVSPASERRDPQAIPDDGGRGERLAAGGRSSGEPLPLP